MLRPKRNDKSILVNLPKEIFERNLRHYQRVERAIFAHIYQEGMS
jgi:hypothetical protein